MLITRTSTSEDYTAALGQALASLLRPGDVIALHGELGAGKTALVRAIAQGLGIDPSLVSSPTFVLVNQYPIPAGASPLSRGQLIHVDAYRLTSAEDLEPLGWDQLLDPETRSAKGNSAAIIEWAGKIEGALPANHATLQPRHPRPVHPRNHARPATTPGHRWRRELRTVRPAREPIRCRVTGRWVPPTSKTYPFIDDRSRDVDMYQWFTGGYKTSREMKPTDEEQV